MKHPSNDDFAIIILAAGRSSRLGQMKQLITIDNKSLVERQIEQALKVSSNVTCVLGFNAESVQARIDHLPVNTIINNQWSDGMASSIALGISALAHNIKAAMIVLVDQWQLTSDDLISHKNYGQKQPHAIVVATNTSETGHDNEKIGPPVIFPQNYFAELMQLTGKQGAKVILKKYEYKLVKVALQQAFIDLDTPEQLNSMVRELAIKSTNNF